MADYGASDVSTTTLGTNQFPISEVYVPNGTLTALEGGPASTDGTGKKSAPMATSTKDGSDVTQGMSTDANTANTVMGRLTKIRDLLLSVLSFNLVDSAGTNKASVSAGGAVKVDNSGVTQPVSGTFFQATQPVSALSLPLPTGAAQEAGHLATIDTSIAASKTDLDTIVTQTLTPNVSDRWARLVGQVDIARYNGAAVGVSNPVLTQAQIQALIAAGQGFSVTTGQLSTATNTNVYIALGIFANNIGKNIYIYQWDGMLLQVYGDMQMTVATSLDASLSATVTPLNDSRGSGTTSLATVKSTGAANTAPTATSGTLRRAIGSAANLGATEFIKQGNGIFLAAGTTQAVTAWVKAPAVGNTGIFNMSYVEY